MLALTQNSRTPQVFDSKNYRQEQNRRRELPEADRKLFDMLQSEGLAQSTQQHKNYPVFDGSSYFEQKERRDNLSPEDRDALDFLKSAQSELSNIDRDAGPGFTGGSRFKKQAYLDSLTDEQRTLLDKVQTENSLRPGGLHPFNQKSEFVSLDRVQRNFVPADFNQDKALRQMAIRGGRF